MKAMLLTIAGCDALMMEETMRQSRQEARLESGSQKFAKLLFLRHPNWRQLARHVARLEEGFPVFYLHVEVPSVNPEVAEPLTLTTGKGEIIVMWFAQAHRHFEARFEGETDYVNKALDFVDALVADKLVMYGCYKIENGASAGISGYWPADKDLRLGWLEGQAEFALVRSWTGTHDRRISRGNT